MKHTFFFLSISLVFVSFTYTACNSSGNNKGESQSGAGVSAEPSKIVGKSSPELEAQLHEMAHDGDLEGVEEAIKSGVDVNGMEEEGRTALMLASFNGHSEIILKLLDAGAVIDRRDGMGRTALLYAATGPFPDAVRILLDKGAEPNVVDSDEHFSPLMHAAAEGNLDVVKILIEAGSNPALMDVDGDNAASFARQAGHFEVATYLEKL